MSKRAPRRRPEAQQTEAPGFAVYDGRCHCGDIVEQPGGVYEAADHTGRVLGAFPSAQAASDAILKHWKAGGGS